MAVIRGVPISRRGFAVTWLSEAPWRGAYRLCVGSAVLAALSMAAIKTAAPVVAAAVDVKPPSHTLAFLLLRLGTLGAPTFTVAAFVSGLRAWRAIKGSAVQPTGAQWLALIACFSISALAIAWLLLGLALMAVLHFMWR